MSIIPASRLSRPDLLRLGHNVLPRVLQDRGQREAIRRSSPPLDRPLLSTPLANERRPLNISSCAPMRAVASGSPEQQQRKLHG